MEPQAIVIVYSGKAPQPTVIEELARVMVTEKVTVPELLEIKHFDGDSLAKAIVTKAIVDFTKNNQNNDTKEVVKHALTLLSKVFDHEIRVANVNPLGLVDLHVAINYQYNDYKYKKTERSEAFYNAMSVIESNIVSRKDYKSFGWSDDVYRVFKMAAEKSKI